MPPVLETAPLAATMTVQTSPPAAHVNVTEPLVLDMPAVIVNSPVSGAM